MKPHIGILLPTGDTIHTDTALCLTDLIVSTGPKCSIFNHKSSILPKSRRLLAEAALKDNSITHLLFIDSDMTFPADAIKRMLEHDKDIIAANCLARSDIPQFTARLYTNDQQVITNGSTTGLQPVWRVGTAFMMIRWEVFCRIPKPWFMIGVNPQNGKEIGEDYWFCQQCDKAGIKIFIDHDLSKEVGHIGQKIYQPEG